MAPDTVRRAIHDYKEEYDVLSEFFMARCEVGPKFWTARAPLYQAFVDWWTEARGRNALSHTAFNRMMMERPDMKQRKREGIRGWRGVAVKDVRTGYRMRR